MYYELDIARSMALVSSFNNHITFFKYGYHPKKAERQDMSYILTAHVYCRKNVKPASCWWIGCGTKLLTLVKLFWTHAFWFVKILVDIFLSKDIILRIYLSFWFLVVECQELFFAKHTIRKKNLPRVSWKSISLRY